MLARAASCRVLVGCALLVGVACGAAPVEPEVARVEPPPSSSAPQAAAAPQRVKPKLISRLGATCQLRSDGAVGCWGGAMSDWTVGPTWVAGLEATDIAFLGSNLVVYDRSGKLWSLPSSTRPERAEVLAPLAGFPSAALSCDGGDCCWLDGDGVVCGKSPSYKASEGEEVAAPARVEGVVGAVSVAVGSSHACALSASGEVRCWGSNEDGEIGVGLGAKKLAPTRVAGLDGVAQIAAEGHTTCARAASGEVFCWGSNSHNTLASKERALATPTRVQGIPAAVHLSMSSTHACAAGDDGAVYCWGSGDSGQLGDGARKDSRTPVKAKGLDDAVAVSTDYWHTCALRRDESVWCWGERTDGRLGDGRSSQERAAVEVEGVSGAVKLCVQHELYPRRTCVIDATRTLKCWGSGKPFTAVRAGVVACNARCVALQSGDVDCGNGAKSVPGVAAVAGEDSRGCGLTGDGSVMCWAGDQQKPKKVMKDATAVAAGREVGCALKAGGELWCWGEVARYGSTKSPVRAAGLGDVAEISLDNEIMLASGVLRRKSGAAEWWYWAMSSFEKGTLDLRTRPLEGVTSAVALDGGAEAGCVALADGHVRCWGSNSYGELGNGASGGRVVRKPVAVLGVDDAVGVSAGDDFNCALRRGGGVKCWGRNDEGQLGKPFDKVQATPIQVRDTRPKPSPG